MLKKTAVSMYDGAEVWANLPGEEVLLVVGEAQGVATARSGQAARTEMARVTGIRLNILKIEEDKTKFELKEDCWIGSWSCLCL